MPRGNPMRPIELRLPENMIREIDCFARQRGVTRSRYIRMCIEVILYGEEQRATPPPDAPGE